MKAEWYLVALILVFMGCVIIADWYIIDAYGFDYISTMPHPSVWMEDPIICINETEDLYFLLRSVKSWEIELNKRTENNTFNYNIAVPDRGYDGKCNVQIDFVTRGIDKTLGLTNCLVLEEVGIIVSCEVTFVKDHPYWYTNLGHEMGHVFGLGHRLPFELSGAAGIVLADDIMQPFASPFDTISEHDIDVLITYYTLDGFGGTNYLPQNYTIPH